MMAGQLGFEEPLGFGGSEFVPQADARRESVVVVRDFFEKVLKRWQKTGSQVVLPGIPPLDLLDRRLFRGRVQLPSGVGPRRFDDPLLA